MAGIDAADGCSQIGTLQARPTTIAVNPLGLYSLLLDTSGDSGDNFTFPVQIDFEDYNNCEGVTFGGENFTTKTISGTRFVGERCLPSISLPTEITSLQSIFAARGCIGGSHNVHDPPRALTGQQVLDPPTSTPAPSSTAAALPESTQAPTRTDPATTLTPTRGSTTMFRPITQNGLTSDVPSSSAFDPGRPDPGSPDPTHVGDPASSNGPASNDPGTNDPATKDPTDDNPTGADPPSETSPNNDPIGNNPTSKDPVGNDPSPNASPSSQIPTAGPIALSPSSPSPFITLPPSPPSPSAFTVGSQTFTALPSAIVAGTVTLTPGGAAATISGTFVSLGVSAFIVGDKTETFAPLPTPPATPAATSVFTVGGETFTAVQGAVLGAGTTLTAGGNSAVVVVDGTTVQVGNGFVAVGGSTVALPTVGQPGASSIAVTSAGAGGADVGGVILSGIGGVGGGIVTSSPSGSGNGSTLQTFTGAGARYQVGREIVWGLVMAFLGMELWVVI